MMHGEVFPTPTAQQESCGVSSENYSKSLEALAWGDNSGGCLGLPVNTSACLLPRRLEPYGLLPGERVVAVACSERCCWLLVPRRTVSVDMIRSLPLGDA